MEKRTHLKQIATKETDYSWEQLTKAGNLISLRTLGKFIITLEYEKKCKELRLSIWDGKRSTGMFNSSDSIKINGSCQALAINAERKMFALATSSGLYVIFFQVVDGELIFKRILRLDYSRPPSQIHSLGISPDGSFLTILGKDTRAVKIPIARTGSNKSSDIEAA